MLKVNIDPDLAATIQTLTSEYAEAQNTADLKKWQVAKAVNDFWCECRNHFTEKIEYYIECSRVANDGLSVAIFGHSGETLRRWCEVQATYQTFPQAETLLEETSFKHLEIAKRAAYKEKTKSPIDAMAWALETGASADDMQEHFFPPEKPTEYDRWDSAMSSLMDKKMYVWCNDAEVINKMIAHVKAIETIKKEYLEKKGQSE